MATRRLKREASSSAGARCSTSTLVAASETLDCQAAMPVIARATTVRITAGRATLVEIFRSSNFIANLNVR
ncbi:hypothetical protein D3C86_2062650 [compost metagenome]